MAVTETGHLASREIDDLYRAHVGEVYRYAFAVLGNHADAEDVTQTTFLNAYRSLEQGVKPRKPSNWLLTIASNAIKQRFRQEQSRPRQVELDDRVHAGTQDTEDDDGPSIGELLTALSKIPPQQRQAIVLREFEGRSYTEIADILGVTTSALETLLFRARRSLAEELEHQLTCTQAQLAVSQSVDDRLGRKERRRLRDHLAECPDCASFARLQKRHRSALRGLALVPIPVSLTLFKGFEGTAAAAVVPISAAGAGAGAVAVGAGVGTRRDRSRHHRRRPRRRGRPEGGRRRRRCRCRGRRRSRRVEQGRHEAREGESVRRPNCPARDSDRSRHAVSPCPETAWRAASSRHRVRRRRSSPRRSAAHARRLRR